MITRAAFALMPVLLAACLLAVGGVRVWERAAAAQTDGDLQTLVGGCADDENKPAPCWQGIIMGETTREDARALLNAHPWVRQTFETDEAISWKWSGRQPTTINPAQDGVLAFDYRRVAGERVEVARLLRIGASGTFGAAYLAFGLPDNAMLVRPPSFSTAYQIAGYGEPYADAPGAMQIITTLTCLRRTRRASTPMPDVRALWDAPFTLGWGDVWYTELINSVRFDARPAHGEQITASNQPLTPSSWMRRMRGCRL